MARHKIKRIDNPEHMPIGEAFEEFMHQKEAQNKSPSTLRNYRQSFGYFMDFHDLSEDTPLNEIKASHFYEWANTLKLDAVRISSINHYLRDTRAFFYWCMDIDRGYIPKRFKIEEVKGQEELPKMFTDEELELLLIKPRRNDNFSIWRTWAIVNWVLATGNRASTICDAKVTDIDYKKMEITLGHTKNRKAQVIPLSNSLATILKEYTRVFKLSYWLFPNIETEQLTTSALAQAFRRYCNDRGVPHANIHRLRHNFAKIWIRNNGNHFTLQRMLGHSTLDMTRHYVRLFTEDMKEDFDKYNPLDTIKRGSRRTNKIERY
jgi:integrase/recombinase XerD